MAKLYDVFITSDIIGRIQTNDIKACIKNPLVVSGIDRANLITFGKSGNLYTICKAWG